jgi:methyl-galactoside transport system substrate-binding protein
VKIIKKIRVFTMLMLITSLLTYLNEISVLANSKLNITNQKITNVGVLLYSFDDLFMSQVKHSLEDIQKENTDKVRFNFYNGKNNIAIQNEILDSLINSNVDLLIVSLANTREETVQDVILKAKQKNVPIVLMEIDPQVISKVSKLYDKAAFVRTDAKLAGAIQGEIIVDLWNKDKSIIDKNGDNILQYVLLKGAVDNPIAIERSNSVISAINNAGIKTQQLTGINANWSQELSRNSVESLFLRYSERIEAIISNNDAMAIGAVEALQKYGYNKGDKSKYIVVVGIDAQPEARNLVDNGFMTGTVAQNTRAFAEGLYTIGTNLINNENPKKDTDYQTVNDEIIIPVSFKKYTA